MTPSLPSILMGQAVAIAFPLPPEAAGDYMTSRLGMIAMLAMLAGQEAERGTPARAWENTALRKLFADAAHGQASELGVALAAAAAAGDGGDLSWSGLDRANADLRRLLIVLHEAAEAGGDAELDRRILTLYEQMAHARRLDLPAFPG